MFHRDHCSWSTRLLCVCCVRVGITFQYRRMSYLQCRVMNPIGIRNVYTFIYSFTFTITQRHKSHNKDSQQLSAQSSMLFLQQNMHNLKQQRRIHRQQQQARHRQHAHAATSTAVTAPKMDSSPPNGFVTDITTTPPNIIADSFRRRDPRSIRGGKASELLSRFNNSSR